VIYCIIVSPADYFPWHSTICSSTHYKLSLVLFTQATSHNLLILNAVCATLILMYDLSDKTCDYRQMVAGAGVVVTASSGRY